MIIIYDQNYDHCIWFLFWQCKRQLFAFHKIHLHFNNELQPHWKFRRSILVCVNIDVCASKQLNEWLSQSSNEDYRCFSASWSLHQLLERTKFQLRVCFVFVIFFCLVGYCPHVSFQSIYISIWFKCLVFVVVGLSLIHIWRCRRWP